MSFTLLAGKDIETFWDTATLSLSSIMFSTRNFLLHSRISPTKSIDHVVLGSDGCPKDVLTLAGKHFFKRTRFL